MLPFCERTLYVDRKSYIPGHNRGIPIAQEPKTIGEHLRRRRAELRISQSEASALLHVSMVTLSRWERDHTYPTWDYHAAISDYLGYDAFRQTGLKDPYSNEPRGVAFLADNAPKEIGRRIRQHRLQLKLTVRGCARKLGVDVKTLRDWERGRHRPLKSMEERIMKFLAVA